VTEFRYFWACLCIECGKEWTLSSDEVPSRCFYCHSDDFIAESRSYEPTKFRDAVRPSIVVNEAPGPDLPDWVSWALDGN
jgi:predicted  nucleic acid-binding Zn-ribbon protein